MTETEWLAATDPRLMLAHIRGRAGDRKLRLFAVACCRRVLCHLPAISQAALTVVERFAEGLASQEELSAAEELAGRATETSDGESVWLAANTDVRFAAEEAPIAAAGVEVVLGWPGRNDREPAQFALEKAEESVLLRCISGNPFRPVAFNPSWRTETAVSLASGIYAERAFDRLPILADALEEAGCDSPDVLAHCRGPGPHARGCWVVDGVLGKG